MAINAPKMEEEFPRIFKSISMMWGSKECRDYMLGLGVQERNEDRDGFPFHILSELISLVSDHDAEFPLYKPVDMPFSNVVL